MTPSLAAAALPGDPPLPGTASRDVDGIVGGSALAGAMIAYGMRRRGLLGFTAGVAGAAILAAVVVPRLVPSGPRADRPRLPRPLTLEGSFVVGRGAADVFAFFRNFEHLPMLTDLLDSVEDFDDGRSRWRIAANDGTMLEWDVIVSKYVPSRVIAWESVGRGPIDSRGTFRLHAVDEATTRVDMTACYAPQTAAAARALRRFTPRARGRELRDASQRIERAMLEAAQPGFYDRVPLHPLPDPHNID